MRCARHGLAASPDGRCVMCRRAQLAEARAAVRSDDRRIHRALRLFIAVIACVATYALLMAAFDTAAPDEHAAGRRASQGQ